MATSRDIARWLEAELVGDDRPVGRLAPPTDPSADSVVVVSSEDARDRAVAGDVAVIVGPAELATDAVPWIVVDEPRAALATLTKRFDRRPVPEGVHPTAVVHPTADLAADVALGANVVVEARAQIGAGSHVGAGSVIGTGSTLGRDCRVHPHVTVYDGVTVGDRAILHAGCVIGADGFGFAPSARGARKIHHLGGVTIGDDVEIGANTCVDRGTLSDTTVGDRTKIDNLCQIGHNVRIGSDVLVAGMCGIGGSTVIGHRVTLAGYVAVKDHVTIHDDATVGGRSGVLKDIPAGETWMGMPAKPAREYARSLALQSRLDRIWSFVKERT